MEVYRFKIKFSTLEAMFKVVALKTNDNFLLMTMQFPLYQSAMRRCGHNPTDIEVSDIINKIHDDTGSLDLEVGFINQEIAVNDI